MAKDRNTVAKRQREVERKRKADEKRERRTRKKQEVEKSLELNDAQFLLSSAEYSVLNVFRKYLMTPDKMLCFSGTELEAFNMPLAQLTSKGFLVPEDFQGGYSLTETGFTAMKHSQ